jgi:hypothetical protein
MPDETTPQWVLDDQEYIANARAKADDLRARAADAPGQHQADRLIAEADLTDLDANANERLLNAKLSGDPVEKEAASLALREMRQHWREIRELRVSGYLHVFADVAADQQGG